VSVMFEFDATGSTSKKTCGQRVFVPSVLSAGLFRTNESRVSGFLVEAPAFLQRLAESVDVKDHSSRGSEGDCISGEKAQVVVGDWASVGKETAEELALVLKKEPGEGKSPRFVLVDALRGVAALWVVLFHASMHVESFYGALPEWVRKGLMLGHNGVPIFFVLSGFVIAHSIGRSEVDGSYFCRFVLRRMLRLDPPYWASMGVSVALAVLSSWAVTGKQTDPFSWMQMAAHLFYLQDIIGVKPLNPTYWTLCLEAQFYAGFCLLVWGAHKLRLRETDERPLRRLFFGVALASLLWPLQLVGENVWQGLFFPLWHGFLLGVFAYWAYRGRIRRPWFYAYAGVLFAGGILGGYQFPATCALAATLLLEAGRAGKLERWLNWPWLQLLGACSYSIYLLHMPLMGAGFNVVYRFLKPGGAWVEALALGLVLGLVFLSAFIFWKCIEAPSALLSRRWARR